MTMKLEARAPFRLWLLKFHEIYLNFTGNFYRKGNGTSLATCTHHIGYYRDPAEAARAYGKALELYWPGAALNNGRDCVPSHWLMLVLLLLHDLLQLYCFSTCSCALLATFL
jgi:hypothetical protein